MVSSRRYRALGFLGAAAITSLAVVLANHPFIQSLVTTYVPLLDRLSPDVLGNGALSIALATTLAVVLASLLPLYKPRPRRILDVVFLTEKRVVVAGLALAAIGYFDYTYRLPRPTLVVVVASLLAALPLFFVYIRQTPSPEERTVLVGNDAGRMREVVEAYPDAIYGYVAPHNVYLEVTGEVTTDGGVVIEENVGLGELDYIGTVARLDDILVDYNVDTALLAFRSSDRAEFFGILDECYQHGVAAKVHREHTDSVLTSQTSHEDIVDIELEPLDPQDYVVKRLFDIAFSLTGLLLLSPVIIAVAVAVKLDSPGPILYRQTRTSEFGDTFTVHKFRSMQADAEEEGARLSDEDRGERDPRVTRAGRFLRKTHLDEVPQLWSILRGDMSVVGPRPERPELDSEMESGAVEWRKRWFVKPGLTGLAQINDATGHEPSEKLRYDLEYIRRQSFWFDLKIVVRQIWMVFEDAAEYLVGNWYGEN